MTLPVSQAQADGRSQIYITFTVTDAALGNPTFYLSGQRFIATNVHGGPPVFPAILSWGAFSKLSGAGLMNSGSAEILINPALEVSPSNGTTKMAMIAWLRQLQFREAVASVYQWNAGETTQELIWKGFIVGFGEGRFDRGVHAVSIFLSSQDRSMAMTTLGTVVTKAAFASAPISSLGEMITCPYGEANNILGNNGNTASIAAVGLPMPGIRGVITDENESTLKVTIRLGEGDGTSGMHTFAEPTADNPGTGGDLWIYDEANSAYGLVDAASYSFVSDANKLEVTVDAAPKVFFFVRPTQIGTTNAAGFTDSDKIIDSDPNNYVVSDAAGNHSWAFLLPSVSFGGRIKSVGLLADWYNAHASEQRRITLGIWDVYHAGGANWMHAAAGKHTAFTRSASLGQKNISYLSTNRYVSNNFGVHDGTQTRDAFASGSFITRNTGDVLETALEMRVFVEDIGGADAGRDGVRLYNVGMIVEVDYPAIPRKKTNIWIGPGFWDQFKDDPLTWQEKKIMESYVERIGSGRTPAEARKEAISRVRGTDFFWRGRCQKDNGSGTYTGTPDDVITKGCDIAHHILHKRKGKTVNTAAGTLGNFVDPRSWGVSARQLLLQPFGPSRVRPAEAIDMIESRFGVECVDEAGTMHCLPDDINPHSSRVYRSTSDPVLITKDDIEVSSFRWSEIPVSDLENSIQFNYCHGYPDREASAQTTYDNHLSQKWFGKKDTPPVDEPACIQQNLESATQTSAVDLCTWRGRRKARPRLIVSCALKQSAYDLKRGHFTGFKDLEDVGIQMPAFRAGLIDYYFTSSSGGTDYADSTAPVFISTGGTGTVYIGLSQQVTGLDFLVGTAANYTNVANPWKYAVAGGIGVGSFVAFSNQVNPQGLKSTGAQRISWSMPNFWEWGKGDLTLGGVTYGPCYWISFDYSTPTVAGLGNGRISYDPIWDGRRFIVKDVRIVPGNNPNDYPKREAVFMEVQ